MSIFQKSVIKNSLAGIDKDEVEKAYQAFQKNYSPEKIMIIKKLKEEEYQDGFLRDIFVDVLGYTLKPDDNFNLAREFKNQSDGRKADGAILQNDKVKAVIELKSTKTKDLKMITDQAFNYRNNQPECKYVITSNFQKLRFYIDYAHEYEEFDLFRLSRQDFELLFLILCKDSILQDKPEKLKKESVSHEENVSKKLYADYSVFRKKLFENLTKNNPDIDRLTLFGKAQKLIDRFLFILFAEDKGLLPSNSINRIIERFHTLKEEDAYKPLYEIYKQYFGYMNTGRPGKRAIDNIPAYNGGLFYPDEVLYDLKIDDDILINDLQKLSVYDFDTEVDVNILGHIFEHSLSEIEETTARIKGIDIDKTTSRRKKDGIFYTPQYITQYIIENTIGRLCREKRKELDIEEIEVDDSMNTKKGDLSKKGSVLFQKIEDYKNWLLSLKILDPACGSGAFLNQALSFLMREHQFIIDIQTDLLKGQIPMFNIESAILENNLYGVDLNEESVEITKLSLWLRTAHKERKLSNLSSNIRCGNSLIDDPEIAGDKAFNWEKEFSGVMGNGGFDVVIGNPPYVRQELLTPYKSYFSEKYQCYSGTADLYVYFYEKGLTLVKESGYFTYISNSFTKTTGAGTELRRFLKNNSRFISFADFSDVQIFDGATTYPIIITLKKEKEPGIFFYLRVKAHDLNQLPHSMNRNSVALKQSELEDSFWTFESEIERIVKKKINAHPTVKDIFGKCYYGVKIGLNEAFIVSGKTKQSFISSNPIENDLMKPFLEGKDLNKWACPDADKWIIFFPKGWTSNISGCKSQQEAWQYISNKYPGIAGYLSNYKEKAIQRHDKGEFWWELRACAYYDFFDSPKIVWPNLQSSNKFSYEDNGFYINAPSVILPTNSKLLLCIVNSKLAWFFFKDICAQRSGGYIEMKPQYFEQFPVAVPDDETPLTEKADIMLSKNKELHELKAGFFNFFKSELTPKKTSSKLENWNTLDWEQFKKEMEKCKVKELSLKERKEWQDYFIEHKEKADKIKSIIDTTDKEIDQMVYELYGLTQEEIEIVEKCKATS